MDSDFENAMVSTPQFRNRLEDGRSKNDEVLRGMWKTVEANTGKVRMAEAEEGRSRKEIRRERKEKEVEERKDGRG